MFFGVFNILNIINNFFSKADKVQIPAGVTRGEDRIVMVIMKYRQHWNTCNSGGARMGLYAVRAEKEV